MFNIGFTELLFLAALALLLIGPKELPQVARMVGRFLNELKRSADVFKEEINKSTADIKPPRLDDILKDKKDDNNKPS
jgi:sec-independent protein translocase protein TatB